LDELYADNYLDVKKSLCVEVRTDQQTKGKRSEGKPQKGKRDAAEKAKPMESTFNTQPHPGKPGKNRGVLRKKMVPDQERKKKEKKKKKKGSDHHREKKKRGGQKEG